MQVQQQTNDKNGQQKRFHVQKWLASISKRDIIIGFVLGLLTYSIAPTLFHIGIVFFASFIYSIQQPQMANAWATIGGIVQTLIAVGAFVWRQINKRKEIKQGQKTEGSSEE